jgi:hypothetical protein
MEKPDEGIRVKEKDECASASEVVCNRCACLVILPEPGMYMEYVLTWDHYTPDFKPDGRVLGCSLDRYAKEGSG